MSVCSVKVDLRTTVGSRAAVTNCLFYGNTGMVDGSVMEVYAGSSLTLGSSAMDGAWYLPAVVWVELDPQRRPLGHVEVNDVYAMPILSGSPFRSEVAMDCHLRGPHSGEMEHPSDGGQPMDLGEVTRDVDGDPVPLGRAWDIGADELDPNAPMTSGIWPSQVVCECSEKGISYLPIYFHAARYAEDVASGPDAVTLVRRDSGSYRTVASVPIVPGGPGVALDTTTPQGLADGHVTFSATDLDLRSGVYVARLVQADGSPIVKAESCRFFLRSTPPDPRPSTNEP
jgi:hypothetical protein